MITLEKSFMPKDTDSAKAMGSGSLNVLATPAVIAFAENTCQELISAQLNSEQATVGVEISMQHRAASKLESEVTVAAKLKEQTKNILTFEFSVKNKDGKLLAQGCHKRAIIDVTTFLERL